MLTKMSFDRQLGDGDNVGSEPSSRSEQSLDLQAEVEKLIMAKFDSIINPLVVDLVDLVNKKIELAQEKRLTSIERNSENEIRSCEGINFKLRFLNKICQPIFTNKAIKGEKSECIQIALFDGRTENIVQFGPEASLKVEIVVLKGDLDGVEGGNLTAGEFAKMIVTEWEGKQCLLKGNLCISLKEGIGSLDNIKFTHNSQWMKKCKFRLGARVVSNGSRVKGAMTEPFTVMDRRIGLYKKHDHPSRHDDVWRLKNIRKGGIFHKRLSDANINTVQEFRSLLNLDSPKLRKILGTGMYERKWEDTVKHANMTSRTDMPSETGQADAHNLAISASEDQNKTNSLETGQGQVEDDGNENFSTFSVGGVYVDPDSFRLNHSLNVSSTFPVGDVYVDPDFFGLNHSPITSFGGGSCWDECNLQGQAYFVGNALQLYLGDEQKAKAKRGWLILTAVQKFVAIRAKLILKKKLH